MDNKFFCILMLLAWTSLLVAPVYAEIPSDSIVAIWLCDEGDGETVMDFSDNGHDGEFVGDIEWVDGKFGKALEFSGEGGNYVEIPHEDSLSLEEWTITAWTKQEPTVGGDWSVVLVKAVGNGTQNYALDMNESGQVFSEVTSGGNWSNCPSTTAVQDGEWHFLAATGDGEVLQVYVDGKMENEQNFGGQDFSDATVTIGGRNDGVQPINGIIDEVGLFNKVLSEEEINNVMTDGLGVATGIAAVEPVGKLTSTWGMLKIR